MPCTKTNVSSLNVSGVRSASYCAAEVRILLAAVSATWVLSRASAQSFSNLGRILSLIRNENTWHFVINFNLTKNIPRLLPAFKKRWLVQSLKKRRVWSPRFGGRVGIENNYESTAILTITCDFNTSTLPWGHVVLDRNIATWEFAQDRIDLCIAIRSVGRTTIQERHGQSLSFGYSETMLNSLTLLKELFFHRCIWQPLQIDVVLELGTMVAIWIFVLV